MGGGGGAMTVETEFVRVSRRCQQMGVLFEDKEFEAVADSLFYHQVPPVNFEWKRPTVRLFSHEHSLHFRNK